MAIRLLHPMVWMPLAVIVVIGCSKPPDEQIVEMARQHAARQAEQNQQITELQKEITAGSRELVAADAASRRELVQLQRDLQADQHEIGRQRDLLEQERQQIARQRFRDQAVATTLSTIGLLLVCGLPLLLCIYVLQAVRTSDGSDTALAEVLVDELTNDRPRLLACDNALPRSKEPRPFGSEYDDDRDADEDDLLY